MNREELIKEAYEYGCNVAIQELTKLAEDPAQFVPGALGALPLVGPLAAGLGGGIVAPEGQGVRGAAGGLLGSTLGGVGGSLLGMRLMPILANILSRGKIKSVGPVRVGDRNQSIKSLSDAMKHSRTGIGASPTNLYRNATPEQRQLIKELGNRGRHSMQAGFFGGGALGGGLGAAKGYDLLTSSPEEE